MIVDTEEETGIYSLVPCEREDVVLTASVSCEYVQAAQQEVVLQSGGRRIEQVCVREGDQVKTGDVLLRLVDDNLEERIENLSYQIDVALGKIAAENAEEQELLDKVKEQAKITAMTALGTTQPVK